MGMAAYKFRLLSRNLLKDQDFWDDLPGFENDGIPVNIKVKCITELPLDTWSKLTLDELRTRLPPRPGPRSLFKAVLRRLSRFQNAVESFKQSLFLENPSRTHLIKPCWTVFEDGVAPFDHDEAVKLARHPNFPKEIRAIRAMVWESGFYRVYTPPIE